MRPIPVTALLAGLILIPLLDQGVKFFVLRRVRAPFAPPGIPGKLQVVRSQIWVTRPSCRLNLAVLWTIWIVAASALAALTALVPSSGWFAGLLLGGSFSHGLETSLRGWICDYVCLKFGPAFNLADVALAIGVIGIGLRVCL